MESKELAQKICEILDSKKAKDIVQISVGEKTIIADYFVIASGRSVPQVKALIKEVDDELGKEGIEYKNREGFTEGRWAVLDYGDVVVHIFHDEARLFYHLERLWEDGDNVVKYGTED